MYPTTPLPAVWGKIELSRKIEPSTLQKQFNFVSIQSWNTTKLKLDFQLYKVEGSKFVYCLKDQRPRECRRPSRETCRQSPSQMTNETVTVDMGADVGANVAASVRLDVLPLSSISTPCCSGVAASPPPDPPLLFRHCFQNMENGK